MSHRHLSGRMVCGLSKWDTEKANRLFIHVLIWRLFLSLLSHFHFKCQRSSFGLCQDAPRGDRNEDATALMDGGGSVALALAVTSGIASLIWTAVKRIRVMVYSSRSTWKKGLRCVQWAEVGGHVWWRTSVSQEEKDSQLALFAWV